MRRGPAAHAEAFFHISLLLLAATGFAALRGAGRLDRPTVFIVGLALLARLAIVAGRMRAPIPERAVWVLTIAYIGFFPFDLLYLAGNFLDATVRLVLFLAVVKLLTARTGRDYFYIGVISFLQLLSAAVLTATPAFLGFLALFLVFAVAARASYEVHAGALTATHRAVDSPMAVHLAVLSAALVAGITLLSIGLFFVVPRAAGAYLSGLPASSGSQVGFSDEVTLGGTGRLHKTGDPVLWVKIIEGTPVQNLKWRGGAFQEFDGVRWSNPVLPTQVLRSSQGRYIVAGERQRRREGPRLSYRVLRQPLDTDSLFLATVPEYVAGDFRQLEVSASGAISLPQGRWRRIWYEGLSFVDPQRPKELRVYDASARYPESVLQRFLQLPDRLDPRIPKLARLITESQLTPYWRAVAIEHHLRTEYDYSLELPETRAADPLAEFLFRRRKGHCEYFASAMTILLRSIGIPARLITGFQSGLYNPVSNSYTVRTDDAHVWVEAYMPGFGWVTFDPTPPDPNAAQSRLFEQLWQWMDAFEVWWNDWVIQYDLNRQAVIASALRNRWRRTGADATAWWEEARLRVQREWRDLRENPRPLFWLAGAAMLALATLRAWPWWKARLAARRIAEGRGSTHDCALLYRRALLVMKKRGYPRQPWQTPGEFLSSLPETPEELSLLTAVYNRARFGRDHDAARTLPGLIRAFETSPVVKS